MRAYRLVRALTCAFVALSVPTSLLRAEDTKGKWQFGFGMSYFSTTDYIRSNSDLAVAGGVVDENGLPNVASIDERPDINMLNQATIKDDFKLDFNASYGLTRWLAVELAASYLKAPVGNIEYYNRDVDQGLSGLGSADGPPNCGPNQNQTCWRYATQTATEQRFNKFLPVGTLTEMPIHASALIRFRPESPLDPYIGLGVGYIMTDLKTSDEFDRKAELIGSLSVSTACEGEYTLQSCGPPAGKFNFVPTPLEANVKNAFEWHAVGGVDYYVSDRLSFYMDARYVWTSGAVDIRTDGAHQVRFAVVDEGQLLLRTRLYQDESDPSKGPYLWEDTGISGCAYQNPSDPTKMVSCAGDKFYETEDKNVNGSLDPNLPGGTEDNGHLYILPPGSRDVGERIGEFDCAACKDNNLLDTEDRNGNQLMDRFLLYGIDICTTDAWMTNRRCTQRTNQTPAYVWPGGCPQLLEQVSVTPTTPSSQAETGCPAFPLDDKGNPRQASTTSGTDDAADLYLVQGGMIRLGGFSLGIGVKFTF